MFLNCPTQYQHVQLNQHVQVNCSVLSKLESKPQTQLGISMFNLKLRNTLNQHVQVNCSVLSKLESKPQTHFNMSKAKEISFHLLSFSWQFYIIE